jgi:hypothetical protein
MQIQIERHHNADHLNSIVNHPDVYKWVKGPYEGPLDFAPVMENEDVIVLMGQHGGVVYHRIQRGLFEGHSSFTPEGRGEWAVACVHATLRWMFSRTEALEVLTRCPQGNVPAKALTRAIGGKYAFTNPTGWVMDGKPVPAEVWNLTIQDWLKTAPDLVDRGRWFHARLKEELARHGAVDLVPPTDDTHCRYIGAAIDMLIGGQPKKAEAFYNRFAIFGGHQPIDIIPTAPGMPLAVAIGRIEIVVNGDDFFVPAIQPSH